jgi:hypothetical protein
MKVYPGFGSARQNPLNGDRAVPGLRLRPGGPTRHDPFLFRAMSGHVPKGTSPAEDSGPLVEDVSQFQSIAGALQYMTFTWPDITYTVQQICLHMHDPQEPHFTAMKRILRYLHRTPDFGLLLRRSFGSDLVAYTDADWAGCSDTRRSTSGYVVFLGDNLVSWSAK